MFLKRKNDKVDSQDLIYMYIENQTCLLYKSYLMKEKNINQKEAHFKYVLGLNRVTIYVLGKNTQRNVYGIVGI